MNKLQLHRPNNVKEKISQTLSSMYQSTGGMSDIRKRRISESMKRRWEEKRNEVQENDKKINNF